MRQKKDEKVIRGDSFTVKPVKKPATAPEDTPRHKKLPPVPGRTPVFDDVPEDEILPKKK